MVKELTFDLHFTDISVQPLTDAGWDFYRVHGNAVTPAMYREAIDAGLHVRFEDAFVRDWLTKFK
jgi:hypothetical protein